MSIYTDLLLLAVVVVYIVDLSGFTDSWRAGLTRLLGVKALRPLPPFDCGQCAVWWTCIIYALAVHQFTIPVLAYAAGLSFLSVTLSGIMIFINEAINALINFVSDKITKGTR